MVIVFALIIVPVLFGYSANNVASHVTSTCTLLYAPVSHAQRINPFPDELLPLAWTKKFDSFDRRYRRSDTYNICRNVSRYSRLREGLCGELLQSVTYRKRELWIF